MELNKIYCGDALTVLKTFPDQFVQCCVTSPPYFNLRTYGVEGQIGLEKTPEEFVDRLVEVFHEVYRVLKDDGIIWVNLGSTYASSVPNLSDCVNRVLKGCLIFGFDTEPIAFSTERVDIPSHNKRSPNSEFFGLFGSQRVSIKNWHNNFHQIFDCLATPRDRWSSTFNTRYMCREYSTPHVITDILDSTDIILSDLDSDLKSELAILRFSGTGSCKSDNTSLAVKEPCEPGTKKMVVWHSTWDSFSLAARSKGVPDIDLVNQSVALRNGALPFICLFGDFKVTKASEQKVTLTSISLGISFVISDVRHLVFSFPDGSFIPYRTVYDKAIKLSNRNCAKQEIDTPHMVKTALQEDGWICRQEIIWHKKSSMPEKVRDRCTKVHEHIFLLSKKPNYKYNYKDILEKTVEYHGKEWNQKPSKKYIKGDNCNPVAPKQTMATKGCTKWHTDENGIIMKNKRSVWYMNAGKSVEGHFAVMPDEMVRTCVIAGSDANDVVLDPFSGSGTVAKIAKKLNRQFVGIDLNPEYVKLSEKKTRCLSGLNLI
jgi:DNA modification methylase